MSEGGVERRTPSLAPACESVQSRAADSSTACRDIVNRSAKRISPRWCIPADRVCRRVAKLSRRSFARNGTCPSWISGRSPAPRTLRRARACARPPVRPARWLRAQDAPREPGSPRRVPGRTSPGGAAAVAATAGRAGRRLGLGTLRVAGRARTLARGRRCRTACRPAPIGASRTRSPSRRRRAAPLGWAYGSYRFDAYKSSHEPATARGTSDRAASSPTMTYVRATRRRHTALARDLINTPASDMTPERLAAAGDRHGARATARSRAKSAGDELRRGFPAIHAVGRAADVRRRA